MESYFDSAFGFSGARSADSSSYIHAQYPVSGVTHKRAGGDGEDDGFNISAYRYHEEDPLVFDGGVRMVWRIGDYGNPHTRPDSPKCYIDKPSANDTLVFHPRPTTVTSYAWVYTY